MLTKYMLINQYNINFNFRNFNTENYHLNTHFKYIWKAHIFHLISFEIYQYYFHSEKTEGKWRTNDYEVIFIMLYLTRTLEMISSKRHILSSQGNTNIIYVFLMENLDSFHLTIGWMASYVQSKA